jgi:hypothetical protein
MAGFWFYNLAWPSRLAGRAARRLKAADTCAAKRSLPSVLCHSPLAGFHLPETWLQFITAQLAVSPSSASKTMVSPLLFLLLPPHIIDINVSIITF